MHTLRGSRIKCACEIEIETQYKDKMIAESWTGELDLKFQISVLIKLFLSMMFFRTPTKIPVSLSYLLIISILRARFCFTGYPFVLTDIAKKEKVNSVE